jgi:hypothetical protein
VLRRTAGEDATAPAALGTHRVLMNLALESAKAGEGPEGE